VDFLKYILIIEFYILPYTPQFGGSQRMHFLSEYLYNNSYKVCALGAKVGIPNFFGVKPEYEMIHLPLKKRPYLILSDSIPGDNAYGKKKNLIIITRKGIKRIARLTFDFFWNDPTSLAAFLSLLWIKDNKKQIIEIIEKKKIDIVLISGPAFSMFKLGKTLRRVFNEKLKIIFDYRDPWNTKKNKKLISLQIEKRLLDVPDKIVLASEKLVENIGVNFGINTNRLEYVYNGFSEKSWGVVGENRVDSFDEGKLVLLSAGACGLFHYSKKNPYPFFEAYKKFHIGKKVITRFVGVQSNEYTLEVKSEIGNDIEFFPQKPQKEVLELMTYADVNLIFNVDIKNAAFIIRGKFFDYLKANKVICGIAVPNTDFISWIKRHKLGFYCENTIESIYSLLEKIYGLWDCGKLQEERKNCGINIDNFSRENQNAKYKSIIEGLYVKEL